MSKPNNDYLDGKQRALRFESIDEDRVKVVEGLNGKEREIATMYVVSKEEIDFFERATTKTKNRMQF